MVKNRNWQVRVEAAEFRRRETKQRKQKLGDKKAIKGWVHSLFHYLDNIDDLIGDSKEIKIHIWTDTAPVKGSFLSELIEDSDSNKPTRSFCRTRSTSMDSEVCTASYWKKNCHGRNRSSSIESEGSAGSQKSAKKKRQESKSHRTEAETATLPAPMFTRLLCRHHFLHGKCDGRSGKKGVCKYFHYPSLSPSRHLTLGTLDGISKATKQDVEAAIVDATPDDIMNSDPQAMAMLYYLMVQIPDEKSLSGEVMAELSRTETPLASVVFMALNGTLIFDRNQDGILETSMETLMNDLLMRTRRPRQVSFASDTTDSGEGYLVADPTYFPGAILEHILTFLPDFAVAASSQVCRSWNHEIGQNSPNLWEHLLNRRNWPRDHDESEKTCETLKLIFQKHYIAVRDIKALASAVPAILTNKHACHATVQQEEVSYEVFASRKYTPQESDVCVALEEWSENHILAGYANECSLRLFQVGTFRGQERRCKELVCFNVDPYKSTKKRTCTLQDIGLDEESIGCLCLVSADYLRGNATSILVVLSREDFLMCDNSAVLAKHGSAANEGTTLDVIDISEAVLNYVLSSDVADYRLLNLFDFLADGGEIGDVVVSVSGQSMVSCGHGRYMVEISIAIPNRYIHDDEEYEEGMMIQLDRKLVLFSAAAGAIVWMGSSYPMNHAPPAPAVPAVLGSIRTRQGGDPAENETSVVIGSILAPFLMTCGIEPCGLVQPPTIVGNSDVVRLTRQPGYQAFPSRSVVINSSDIITNDSIFCNGTDGQTSNIKSSLSFFSRNALGDFSNTNLSGNTKIHDMVCLRDEYLVALCTELVQANNCGIEQISPEFGGNVYAQDPAEDLVGQWFAPESTHSISKYVENLSLIVVHISSRQEIGRVSLEETNGSSYERLRPRLIRPSLGSTLAIAFGGYGIAMTGEVVRGVKGEFCSSGSIYHEASARYTKKKKAGRNKNKNCNGGHKKDRFTRGLSIRG